MRPASDDTGRDRRRKSSTVVAALALTGTVVSLQQTLVIPLLPEFPRLLDTSAENASWLVTATLLTGAVATPTAARLADMFGKRRMMLTVLAITVCGSVVGALGQELWLIIAGRALQGVGVALVPVGIAIMRDELPWERLHLGVAVMSATLAIGAGLGLPLSGVLLEHLGWHAIFWVTGIGGVIMFLVLRAILDESPVKTRGRFDYVGAVLLSASLTAILLALSKGGHWGWTSMTTVGVALAGVVLLLLWLPYELRVGNPLVDLRVAGRRSVLLVNGASVFTGFAMFANMLVTVQLLQTPPIAGFGLGLDPLATGLWMAPSALTFGVMAPFSALISRRFGPAVTLLAGTLVMSGTYAARVFLTEDLWQIVLGSVIVALGTSMTYAAMPSLIMRAVPVTETASANGLNTLLRSIGTSASSATMSLVAALGVVQVGADVYPSEFALTTYFWLSAGAALVAGLITLPMLKMPELTRETEDVHGIEGRGLDTVVRWTLVSGAGRPVPHAVVTLLTPTGSPVDWGHSDPAGQVALAVPSAGRYLLVMRAEGWAPESRLLDVVAGQDIGVVTLPDRLTVNGRVADEDGIPGKDAVVILTAHTGEIVASVRSDAEGFYEFPLPANGRYVLTAATLTFTTSRTLLAWGASLEVELVLPTRRGTRSVSATETNRAIH